MVGHYRGDRPGPALLTGSHYDTVRNGGKYDGRLGIYVPLACVRALAREGRRLPFGLEVVAFAEEEGQRYKATFLGSGALTGAFDPAWLEQKDADGITMREAMRNAGLPATLEAIGTLRRDPAHYLGFVEVHIEQGPVLNELNLPLGIVTSINGGVRYACEAIGMASHAGTTPMDRRRDAAAAVAELALYVERRAARDGDSVGTIGILNVPGGSTNVVPGRCQFTLDLRAPTDAQRDALVDDVLAEMQAICERRGVRCTADLTMRAAAAPSDRAWQLRWERAVAGPRHARAPHAQRRRPRRDEAARSDAAGHAVRARPERRHQPQPAGEHDRRRHRAGGARVPEPARSTRPRDCHRMTDHDRVDAWIDAHFDEEVRFLQALVRVPTDTPPGNNAPHAERTADLLQAFGFHAERHPVPAQEVQARGLQSITNLVVRRRYGEGPVIALNAHGDVVPPGDGWSHDPYAGVIDGGFLYGRAAAVSKSDFATFSFAVQALEALGVPLRGGIELHFTYDEEFGGELGPGWLLKNGITRPDLLIAAGFSYQVVVAHNGCLQMEVTVHGQMSHAAIPDSGTDALQGATHILNALYALNRDYTAVRSKVDGIDHPYLNVGLHHGRHQHQRGPGQGGPQTGSPHDSGRGSGAGGDRAARRHRCGGAHLRPATRRQGHPRRRAPAAPGSLDGAAAWQPRPWWRRCNATARRCSANPSPPSAPRSTPTCACTPRPASPA